MKTTPVNIAGLASIDAHYSAGPGMESDLFCYLFKCQFSTPGVNNFVNKKNGIFYKKDLQGSRSLPTFASAFEQQIIRKLLIFRKQFTTPDSLTK